MKKITNLAILTTYYCLPDLKELTLLYLVHNTYLIEPNPSLAAACLADAPLEAFNTIQVPVPNCNNSGYTLYRIHCTGSELFWKKEETYDLISIRRWPPSPCQVPGSLDGKVPARLNALFKIRDSFLATSYLLAYI